MNEKEFVSDPMPFDVLYHMRGQCAVEDYLLEDNLRLRHELAQAQNGLDAWRTVAKELLGV